MHVGDYVITNDRLHIGKIYNINEFREPSMMYAIDIPKADDFIFMGESDFKSSPRIIDLIQAGDFVNGFRVVWKDEKEFEINAYYEDEKLIKNSKQIKSIVTKEQFESMKYEVKE